MDHVGVGIGASFLDDVVGVVKRCAT